jgi:hypothetical protein
MDKNERQEVERKKERIEKDFKKIQRIGETSKLKKDRKNKEGRRQVARERERNRNNR